MASRALIVLVAALTAGPCPAAQVDVAPDAAGVPAAPIAPVPFALTATPLGTFAPSAAAPLALAAPALAPALPPSAAAAAPSSARPAAVPGAAANRDGSHQTLLQTLSAALPDASRMSGAESSEAAAKDFAARAQLDGPAPADGSASAVAAVAPAGGVADVSGKRMRGVIDVLNSSPINIKFDIDFIPSARSLREIGAIGRIGMNYGYEVGLVRDRNTQRWAVVKGYASSVNIPRLETYDIIIHSHPPQNMGRSGVANNNIPSTADLGYLAGLDARLFLISDNNLIEWSPKVSYPGNPGKLLSYAAPFETKDAWMKEVDTWVGKHFLERLALKIRSPRRFAMLDLLGIRHKIYSLKDAKTQALLWPADGR